MSTCLSYRILELAAGGSLDAAVEAHIAGCARCRERLDDVRSNNRFLSLFAPSQTTSGNQAGGVESTSDRSIVPGYTIRRVIGRGGQGVVYDAVQVSTVRRVALKVMLAAPMPGSLRRERFEREIRLASDLNHPGIVTLFDSGVTTDGHPYFAMEYVEGVPIDRFARPIEESPGESTRPPTVAEALGLFRKVCDAVRHAHLRGIIHRDLKPGNIIVDAAGDPHVLDFGLAKRIDEGPGKTLTLTGAWQGTIAYAAPEQLARQRCVADTRTDVHALGLILYELLTGRHPFDIGGTIQEIVHDVAHKEPVPPSRLRAGIDDEIDVIVRKALAKEPEQRYASAAALLDDLVRYEERRPLTARPDSTWYLLCRIGARHPGACTAAAVGFVLLLALGGWILSAERRARDGFRRASVSAGLLATKLAESEIRRGRDAAPAQAERLIWRHHLLRTSADGPSRPAQMHDPPGLALSYWALVDLYRRHPCLASESSGSEPITHVSFVEGDGVRFVRGDRLHSWHPGMQPSASAEALPRSDTADNPAQDSRRLLSDDGQRIATACGRMITVHDADGRRLGSIEVDDTVAFLAGDATLQLVAAATTTHRVVAFRLADGEVIWSRAASPESLFDIAMSPDGKRLAVLLERGAAELYDLPSLMPSVSASTGAGFVRGQGRAAFDRGGTTFAICRRGSDSPWRGWDRVEVWQKRDMSWQLETSLVGTLPWFGVIDVVGSTIAATQRDRILLYDLARIDRRTTPYSFGGHRADVRVAALSGDARLLATGDSAGVLKLWETRPDAGADSRPDTQQNSYQAIAHSPDGRWLAAAGSNDDDLPGFVQILSTAALDERSLQSAAAIVSAVAWSAGSDRCAWARHDGMVHVGTVDENGHLEVLRDLRFPGPINALAFVGDGEDLVVAADAGAWYLPGLDAESMRPLLGPTQRVPSIATSPDGRLVAAGCMDRSVRVWPVGSSESFVLGRHEAGVRVLRFSPDGRVLASAGDGGHVNLWDLRTRRCITTLEGHAAQVFALAWSPTGTVLASGDSTGELRIWDPTLPEPLATLRHDQAMFASLEFTPGNGRHLAAGSLKGGITRWDLRHYDRHIAGNLDHQLELLAAETTLDPASVGRWRRWAADLLEASSRKE